MKESKIKFRIAGYSFMYNPWHCLIFEALESVTSSLSFTAAVTYAAKLSTITTDSSIQGLLGGLYYGVGKGFGSLIGGYLMKAFGTRPTYQIFAALSLITGIIYFFFNLLYLKKQPQVEGNDIVKKKPKKLPNLNQNGIENGPLNLAERNEMKKLEADGINVVTKVVVENGRGIDNEAFVRNFDDIEAINNARNLDRIEKLPEDDEEKNKKKNIPTKSIDDSDEDISKKITENHTKSNDVTKINYGGIDNRVFVKETTEDKTLAGTGKCDVTIERQPDDVK